MKNIRERKYFISFLSILYNCIHDKIELYLKDRNRINFTAITNYIIFFMILFLNVSDTGIFIKTIFEEGINFFQSLIKLIEKFDLKDKNSLFGILNNLFLDDYKLLYFKKNTSEKDDSLEMLFINNQIYFSNIYFESEEGFGDKEYRNMFNKLSRFEFSYDNFFKDKNIDNIKDKSYYKLRIAQSIIRVVFSKEKYLYIDESSKTSKYFEYYFIKNLIDKDLEITQKKYGNDISIIFRKEDIFDDIIKYIFYIFGNTMMIESFVKPVEKMLKKIGLDEESIENNILVALDLPLVRDINKEEFEILIKEISESLNETMPLIIKIILKFLYNSLIKYYKIDKNNFNPLYTALFFNYIISPKTQEMFEINPMKILLVRSLNKLVKNTCFKYKINEADNLSKFTDLIEKYNINMKNLIINNVIQLDENEESNKKYMKQLFSEINLVYPKFLFYRDSKLISKTFNGVSDEFINYREL